MRDPLVWIIITQKQNGDRGLPSIILMGRGILLKTFITLKPHDVFYVFANPSEIRVTENISNVEFGPNVKSKVSSS